MGQTRAEQRRASREREYAKVPKLEGKRGMLLDQEYRLDALKRAGAKGLEIFMENIGKYRRRTK